MLVSLSIVSPILSILMSFLMIILIGCSISHCFELYLRQQLVWMSKKASPSIRKHDPCPREKFQFLALLLQAAPSAPESQLHGSSFPDTLAKILAVRSPAVFHVQDLMDKL